MANALQAVLDRAAKQSQPEKKPTAERKPRQPKAAALKAVQPKVSSEEPAKFHRPVRDGKRFVGAHFPPEVAKQLRMIAAEDDTTIQALLEEAVDLLFAKKGRATIASLVA